MTTERKPFDFEAHCAEISRRHWEELRAEKDSPSQARIKGKCYTIQPDAPKGTPHYFLGFGGGRFDIQFHDGRKITTHNLWYRGEIPEELRAEMPDNAEFVEWMKPIASDWDRWIHEQERRREELKKQPWIPKWKWKKQRGIP